MIAMRELSPANDSDKKKTMAKNLPPSMLPNNNGILQRHTNNQVRYNFLEAHTRDGEALSVNTCTQCIHKDTVGVDSGVILT